MSVVNNMIRHYALIAIEKRMVAIGKTMEEIMPQEVEEILECVVRDSEKYVIDYDRYVARIISSGGKGVLRLNI